MQRNKFFGYNLALALESIVCYNTRISGPPNGSHALVDKFARAKEKAVPGNVGDAKPAKTEHPQIRSGFLFTHHTLQFLHTHVSAILYKHFTPSLISLPKRCFAPKQMFERIASLIKETDSKSSSEYQIVCLLF